MKKLFLCLCLILPQLPGSAQVKQKPTVRFEDVRIYRLQVTLTTADVSDAGTDDPVFIMLNSKTKKYFLNTSGDDRERKQVDSYDIVTDDIKSISDIGDIRVVKIGNDGWALKRIEIRVNNILVVDEDLHTLWLDGNNGHSPELLLLSSQIRQRPLWNFNGNRATIGSPPSVYSKQDLINIIESVVGNMMRQDADISWGNYTGVNTRFGDVVELSFFFSLTLHADLDLQLAVSGANQELDVDFDLVISCVANVPTVTIEHVTAKSYSSASLGYTRPPPLFLQDALSFRSLGQYLSRRTAVTGCASRFIPNGNLVY